MRMISVFRQFVASIILAGGVFIVGCQDEAPTQNQNVSDIQVHFRLKGTIRLSDGMVFSSPDSVSTFVWPKKYWSVETVFGKTNTVTSHQVTVLNTSAEVEPETFGGWNVSNLGTYTGFCNAFRSKGTIYLVESGVNDGDANFGAFVSDANGLYAPSETYFINLIDWPGTLTADYGDWEDGGDIHNDDIVAGITLTNISETGSIYLNNAVVYYQRDNACSR